MEFVREGFFRGSTPEFETLKSVIKLIIETVRDGREKVWMQIEAKKREAKRGREREDRQNRSDRKCTNEF